MAEKKANHFKDVNRITMKIFYIKYLLCALAVLTAGCSKHGFEQREQNPAPFTKKVTLEELMSIYKEAPTTLSPAFYTEGIVVGTENDAFYLQEKTGLGVRVLYAQGPQLAVGQRTKVVIGGSTLSKQHEAFFIADVSSVEQMEPATAPSISLPVSALQSDWGKYASSLVSVSGVSLRHISDEADGKLYEATDNTGTTQVFVPGNVDITIPAKADVLTGVLTWRNDAACLSIRMQDDIQEAYVEPPMMDRIVLNTTLVRSVIASSETEIAPGVKRATAQYINSAGLVSSFNMFEIDLNNPDVKLEGGTPNNAPPPITAIHTLASMAAAKNAAYEGTGWRVLAATTGDFYVTTPAPVTYIPNGPFVRNGTVLKDDFYAPADEFFGILKNNGGFVLGRKAEFDASKNNLQEALGGRVILKDGEVVVVTAAREPRTAIGYSDRNKVYLFVGDGRKLSLSNGFSPVEMAEIMKGVGAAGAVYMNGGGATVAVVENPATGQYDKISQSHATNDNHNPSLAICWTVMVKQ